MAHRKVLFRWGKISTFIFGTVFTATFLAGCTTKNIPTPEPAPTLTKSPDAWAIPTPTIQQSEVPWAINPEMGTAGESTSTPTVQIPANLPDWAVIPDTGVSVEDEPPASSAMPGVIDPGDDDAAAGSVMGPLRVHPLNPRYFINGAGRLVYLTGSHNWYNMVDKETGEIFDYSKYLDFLQQHNHNYIRLWTQWAWMDGRTPDAYQRTGPGNAQDGKPKFDLGKFNQAYFDRIRQRIIQARDRGFYVSVMLFEGWDLVDKGEGNPWYDYPFNLANNINGINGDTNGNGSGEELETLADPAVLAYQEAYVRKVIDTVNDLDNVLIEISNEAGTGSVAWQYHMIEYVKAYEANKPKQHLVIMSSIYPNADGAELWNSDADVISPGQLGGGKPTMAYRDNPPNNDGSKVVINDTDHTFGVGGDRDWVWKSFTRGLHPIFMDPLDTESSRERARKALGQTLAFAKKMSLASMTPREDLASTRYCLAKIGASGAEFLVYSPYDGAFSVNLTEAQGQILVEWFNPSSGETIPAGFTTGGTWQSFTPPFGGDAVLYLKGQVTYNHPLMLPVIVR